MSLTKERGSLQREKRGIHHKWWNKTNPPLHSWPYGTIKRKIKNPGLRLNRRDFVRVAGESPRPRCCFSQNNFACVPAISCTILMSDSHLAGYPPRRQTAPGPGVFGDGTLRIAPDYHGEGSVIAFRNSQRKWPDRPGCSLHSNAPLGFIADPVGGGARRGGAQRCALHTEWSGTCWGGGGGSWGIQLWRSSWVLLYKPAPSPK